jgi:DNA-binding transcriptional LysR family regulator
LDFPDHPDLVKEFLLDTEHVIVAHQSHPLAALAVVTPEDLLEHPFIGFASDYAGLERMEKFFAVHGMQSPGLSVEASSLEMLLSLLCTGAFLASLSVQVLDRSGQTGLRRLNVTESFWRFKVGAVYRRSPQPTALVGTLLRALRTRLAGREA